MRGVSILFLISTLLFLLISLHDLLNLKLPNWILFYGNDFLCMPVVLSICLFAARSVKKDAGVYLSMLIILSLTIFYALFFELVLPKTQSNHTADFVDVLMYIAGAGLFYLVQKKDQKRKIQRKKSVMKLRNLQKKKTP